MRRKKLKGKYTDIKVSSLRKFIKNNKLKLITISSFLVVLTTILLINSPKDNVLKSSYKKLLANNGIYTEEIKSIDITTDNYDEPGSFKVTKKAEWTGKDTAQLELEFNSKIKADDHNKDIVLVFDTSASMIGNKLDTAKNDIANLIEYMFNDETDKDNHLSIITFNTTSRIVSPMTNNKEELLNSLDSITAEGRTNYNAGLSNVDTVLEEYGYAEKENTDLIVLFVVDGYPNVETPKEISTVRILKEKYPNLKINSVQLDLNNKNISEVSTISDAVFEADVDKLGSAVMDAAFNPDVYENLEITDIVDDTYFDIEDVSRTKGETRLDDNKVIWNLDNTSTGSKEKVTIKIKVKDRYKDEESYFPTNKKISASYKLIDKDKETITTNDTPVLKNYYTVTYDTNAPEGCNIENIPSETHIIFNNVQEKTEELSCEGYHFKGWRLETDSVRKINHNTFIMPKNDVIYRATWAKQSINKTMDGTVYTKPILYNVLKNEAKTGIYAKEYTGEHADSYDRNGTEKIYHWYGLNDTTANTILDRFNVIFANHCWQMLRTTDTGGVKLIYNGEPDDNNSCNLYRKKHVGYYGATTLTLNNNYYYSTDYAYNIETKAFSLIGDKTNEKWSNSTYDSLLGKYTCMSTNENETCSTIYYIESFYNASQGYAYALSSDSNYSEFGHIYFNTQRNSPADVGYMYNTRYTYSRDDLNAILQILPSSSLSTSYYYAENYDYGETTTNKYTLTNPYRIENTTDYASLVGKYTFKSSTDSYNDSTLYYIVDVIGSYMYYIEIKNGQTVEDVDKTYTFGDGYTDNGDGTYTLTNAVSYKQTEWPTNIDQVKTGMYTCASASNICSTPYYIIRSTISYISHSKGKYVYGNSFKYELNENTGKYEYKLEDTIAPNAPVTSSELANHHYTCFNETGVCEEVKYIYYLYSTAPYYITIKNGKDINDVLNEMFKINVNIKNSTIKGAIDAWYKHYMEKYSGYLEDTVFCNDRSIASPGGWDPNGGSVTNRIQFNGYTMKKDLSCSSNTDRFSTLNNTATLTYPVGIATVAEMALLNYDKVRATERNYWLQSPSYFDQTYASESYVHYHGSLANYSVDRLNGVRPVISLKPGTEYSDGDGSQDHPYIIDTEGD